MLANLGIDPILKNRINTIIEKHDMTKALGYSIINGLFREVANMIKEFDVDKKGTKKILLNGFGTFRQRKTAKTTKEKYSHFKRKAK